MPISERKVFNKNVHPFLNVTVYFKIMIDDKIPPEGQLGNSGLFIAHSCIYKCLLPDSTINTADWLDEFRHSVNATTSFGISSLLQPNINVVEFNKHSFHERKAKMNDPCELYMILRPNTLI